MEDRKNELIKRMIEVSEKHDNLRNEVLNSEEFPQDFKDKFKQIGYKFKVGDEVIGNEEANRYNITGKGWIGKVTKVKEEYFIAEGDNGDDDNSFNEFCLYYECFDLHKKGNPQKQEKKIEYKFNVGDKAIKVKGYKFPCTIVSVFKTVDGNVRVVGEMDEYGLLHIFNEDQLEKA